jgi:hypothetical protein
VDDVSTDESALLYRRGKNGELVPHEAEQAAIREMLALRAQGKALRAIAKAMQAAQDQP